MSPIAMGLGHVVLGPRVHAVMAELYTLNRPMVVLAEFGKVLPAARAIDPTARLPW